MYGEIGGHVYRVFSCKAWIDRPGDAELLQSVTDRLREACADAAPITDLRDGKRAVQESLSDLWYPLRQMAAGWYVIGRKQQKRRSHTIRRYQGIVFAGVFCSSWSSFEDLTVPNPRRQITISKTRNPGRPGYKNQDFYTFSTPVFSKSAGPESDRRVQVTFTCHRSNADIAIAQFRYFFLVARPKFHNGTQVGWAWRLNMLVQMPEPEKEQEYQVNQTVIIRPTWRAKPDGQIVAMDVFLANGEHREYCLPQGSVKRWGMAIGEYQRGISNKAYTRWMRWRDGLYHQWAKEILSEHADFIIEIQSEEDLKGLLARHRKMVQTSHLIEILHQRAQKEGRRIFM
ncbi:hypothetical protein BAE30_02220 [Acidithiobacillus caldus]|uniref:Uncharacterized protein n=1 Tax=Acidithiobacillus caldus TaxID=33059 RepID=A0A1E7Z0P6_9PROT|nr:hypothetical protein BAE30_02220 [Acidithiobacillus caldus]